MIPEEDESVLSHLSSMVSSTVIPPIHHRAITAGCIIRNDRHKLTNIHLEHVGTFVVLLAA